MYAGGKNLFIERLVNQRDAFEGGGMLPAAKAGQRLRSVSDLRVLRNESINGGAKLTIAWIEDNATISENSFFEINVYATQNFGLWSSAQNINNVSDISKLTPLQTVTKTKKSPVELTVYVPRATPVTIVVTLRHSSGVTSLSSFASAVTAFVRPLGNEILTTVETAFTMPKGKPLTLLVNASGNHTTTLPPISEVIDGLEQTVKLISSSAITVTLTPVASGLIEDAATAVINNRYGSVTYYADRASNKWWIKSRLP